MKVLIYLKPNPPQHWSEVQPQKTPWSATTNTQGTPFGWFCFRLWFGPIIISEQVNHNRYFLEFHRP
ncbi:hypothetical protein V6N11_030770 [Hibiscus sabdariffa]|uniref:Uncharacterized protein n=2 Tax=Hibiscus sabdariffa TaxID=183260 RepID=A0ABR2NBV2_9ROSI